MLRYNINFITLQAVWEAGVTNSNPLQNYNRNEQQRKRPDLNMTETLLDISVPEIQ